MRPLFKATFVRNLTFPNVLHQWLQNVVISPKDRRWKRNINRLRGALQKMIENKRKIGQQSTDTDANSDLLSILVFSEFF
jgi:hypothetical protein